METLLHLDDRQERTPVVEIQRQRKIAESWTLPENNFEVLVSEIKGVKRAIEKLEKRYDDSSGEIFDRMRAVELDHAVTKTKLFWIVLICTGVTSTVVSVASSLLVHWLTKK